MKKILTTLFIIFLFSMILPFSNNFNNVVYSDGYYPMSCPVDEFEVSYIENDGSLTHVNCRSHYANAVNDMKQNPDYVIRHANSYSPTKIVAMNSGVAYSYPARSGSITMNLYQNLSAKASDKNNYKYTYITDNYEMTYYDTLADYESNMKSYGKGFIKVSINGFDGYVELEYCDLVPSKYINNGIAIYVGGSHDGEAAYNSESPYKVICHQNYYSIEKNGNYYDLVFHYFCDCLDDNGLECYSNSISIDNATNYLNAGMSTGARYYSNDGINFYSDRNCKNLVAQVYGYYQYMSLRTKTNIPASTFNNFLVSLSKNKSVMLNQGQSFINAQNSYGSNALIIFAMACQESGYGESGYARDNKNLFGWGAYDADPDNAAKYESVEQCINQQMGRNLNWFMDCTNYRYAGTSVGNKGTGINMLYCSDPYWGLKIAAIAYRIDKYNNGNNGNLTDYNSYTYGVVYDNYNDSFGIGGSNWNTPIYTSPNGNTVLYNSKFNNNYQKDLTVSIIEKAGNRYKVNIANPIINGKLYIDDGLVGYDWNLNVGYIDCNRVSLMNNSSPKSTATYDPYFAIYDLNLNSNILSISGLGAIQGLDFLENNQTIVHELVFRSIADKSEIKSFVLSNVDSEGYDMNDGYNYKMAGFAGNIDLSCDELVNGSYYLALRTTNSGHTVEETLRSSFSNLRLKVSQANGKNYKITANPLATYRMEIDIIDSPINYTTINKPSVRTSVAAFDSIGFDDNGNLVVIGEGYISILDFDNKDDISYEVYFVKDSNNYIKLNTTLRDDEIDYTSALNSTYKLNYISFAATSEGLDITPLDLEDGEYRMTLMIKNGDYIDYVDFTNRENATFNAINNDVKKAELLTSNIRKTIVLNVSTINTGE